MKLSQNRQNNALNNRNNLRDKKAFYGRLILVRDKGNFLPGCVQKGGVRNMQATKPYLNCRFITEIEFKLLFLKKEKKRKENKAAHLQKLLV